MSRGEGVFIDYRKVVEEEIAKAERACGAGIADQHSYWTKVGEIRAWKRALERFHEVITSYTEID